MDYAECLLYSLLFPELLLMEIMQAVVAALPASSAQASVRECLPSAGAAILQANRSGGHCGFVAGLVIASNLPGMFDPPTPLTLLTTLR